MRRVLAAAVSGFLGLVLVGCGSSGTSVPAPVITVAVTAAAATADAGQAVNLTATLTNDTGARGVQWAVQCAAGATCGVLSNQTTSSATYTVPAGLTANVVATVTATSVASPAVMGSATVTGVPLPTVPSGPGTINPTPAPVVAGGAISYTLQASGGVAPLTWSVIAGTLPPGVTLNAATGVVSGTATTGGTYTVTFQVMDSGSPAKTASVVVPFTVIPPLVVTTTSLSAATAGTAYFTTVLSTGGTAPFTWSLSAGALPAGLTISSGGVISGTPTVGGSFPITVKVVDSSLPQMSATAALTLTVTVPTLTVVTTSLGQATAGAAYTTTLQASGGIPAYTWTVVTGSLPSGVTLSSGGVLSGTPAAAGVYPITVRVTDSETVPLTATQALTLTVIPGPVVITTAGVGAAKIYVPYSATLAVSGGTAPFTWTLQAGNGTLPTGLTLSAGGVISGTPTIYGSFPIQVLVTDAASQRNNTALTVIVTPPYAAGAALQVTTNTLDQATTPAYYAGAYSQTLTAVGGTGAYTWSLAAGSGALPAGITLSSTGVLGGSTAVGAGSYPIVVQVADSATPQHVATQALTLTVAIPPKYGYTVLTQALPDATVGSAYRAILIGGGAFPFNWVLGTGSSLPGGLALSNTVNNSYTGTISGVPTTAANYSFTVQLSGVAQVLTLNVVPAGFGIATNTLGTVTQGAAYSATLDAGGGVGPYTWSLASGSGALPTGLSLSSGGVISGTATVTGNFPIVVKVADSSSPQLTATQSLTVTVVASLAFSSMTLPAGTQNFAYTTTAGVSGGIGPYTWTLVAGSLPAGLTMTSAGVVSGTPTAPGTFTFTLGVHDSATPNNAINGTFTMVVNPPLPVTVTTTSLPGATLGSPYAATMQASGGTTPTYTWSIISGSLPPGVVLDGYASGTRGVFSGVPTSSGTYSFTVQATGSGTATQNLSITVAPLAGTNNSLLSGHYAFRIMGFADYNVCGGTPVADQPMLMVGTFTADGSGNLTQGMYDSYVCGKATASHTFAGPYAVGADHRGRMVMTNIANSQSTFAFSVGQIVGGVAQQAQFIEFDDVSDDYYGVRGSGLMLRQDTTTFTGATLSGNFVYGLAGFGQTAGLWSFNGSGGITGPSVSGTYVVPDAVTGRFSMTVNGTGYVGYVVSGQEAFVSATGTALPSTSVAAGEMRLQQSAPFNAASLNGKLVGYGVAKPSYPNYSNGSGASGYLDILTADGVGNLTGTDDTAIRYGPTAVNTTYSISSNGLVVLGTGQIIWLYGQNAGYSANVGLMTYESAVGGPFTFDASAGYSVGVLAPPNPSTTLVVGSASATDASSQDYLGGNYGLSTTSTIFNCFNGCGSSVNISNGRAISVLPVPIAGNVYTSGEIVIYQK